MQAYPCQKSHSFTFSHARRRAADNRFVYMCEKDAALKEDANLTSLFEQAVSLRVCDKFERCRCLKTCLPPPMSKHTVSKAEQFAKECGGVVPRHSSAYEHVRSLRLLAAKTITPASFVSQRSATYNPRTPSSPPSSQASSLGPARPR